MQTDRKEKKNAPGSSCRTEKPLGTREIGSSMLKSEIGGIRVLIQ